MAHLFKCNDRTLINLDGVIRVELCDVQVEEHKQVQLFFMGDHRPMNIAWLKGGEAIWNRLEAIAALPPDAQGTSLAIDAQTRKAAPNAYLEDAE